MSFLIIFSIVGCNKTSNSTNNTDAVKNDIKQEETKPTNNSGDVKKNSNTQIVDGLTLSATAKIQSVKGDRTKDNVADENGEYIADGSNIVKAADYKKIVVSVDIKNDTDKAVQINPFYWGAELQDGYKLERAIEGDEKEDQIQSKSNGKYEFYYIVKNDIKADKIKLSYLWVKNEEEFKKLINDPNLSKMSEQEAKEKYKDVFTSIKLETDIQK